MTEVLEHKSPVAKRMKTQADLPPEKPPVAAIGPRFAKYPWLSMDDNGPNPPPKDGKPIMLTPDGGGMETAVEAWWRNTRYYARELNGGRGGWGHRGWWCVRYLGAQPVKFEPIGWAPTRS